MNTNQEAVVKVLAKYQDAVLLNWWRARWTACFIAITTIVCPAQSQQTKPAEPNVAAANRAVQSQLPNLPLHPLAEQTDPTAFPLKTPSKARDRQGALNQSDTGAVMKL